MLKLFKAARRVSTPLIAIRTPDPAATMQVIVDGFNGSAPPCVVWDVCSGLRPINKAGSQALSALGDGGNLQAISSNPSEALSIAAKLPEKTVVFALNMQRYILTPQDGPVVQGVWNLRDPFKTDRRTLVLLCPDLQLPSELAQDVLILDEPLPDKEQLAGIIREQFKSASLDEPDDATLNRAVDATAGLAAFPAEQVTAMSLTKDGIDFDALWERKRKMIEQTPGLSVWRGGQKFSDIGGLENAKSFLNRVIGSRKPPKVVVMVDEIEKSTSESSQSDSNGINADQLKCFLTEMEDKDYTGFIAVGHPGCSKSMIAKATGAEAGVPCIVLDLGGMKGSLVGQSEQNLRQALKVIAAVAGPGGAYFIATSNGISAVKPELKRRFRDGIWFFDLPCPEERDSIWDIYVKKFEIKAKKKDRPNDEGWTGAEIRQCCEFAWRLQCSLAEAAEYIVPFFRAAADKVNSLRTQADGRYISASKPGVYRNPSTASAPAFAGKSRNIETE